MTVQKLTYPSKENAVQEKINEIIDNLGGGSGSYTAGTGIDITNDVISVTSPTLTNTATGTNSLTIRGTATTYSYAVNIGENSSAYNLGVAVGYASSSGSGVAIGYASEGGTLGVGVGNSAKATGYSSIQIGQGTNSTNATMNVGFANNNTNYTLLDGTTGLIPDARISSNIARTTDIPAAQVNSDWNAVSGVAEILNKPTLGTMASESASDYTPTSGLATVATSGAYSDLSGTPTAFTGADGTNAGTSGLVPAPSATDNTKFLKGDGTWGTPSGGSSYTAGTGIDITSNTISVASPTLINRANNTSDLTICPNDTYAHPATVGNAAINIGDDSQALQYHDIAIGGGAKAGGGNTIAIGNSAKAGFLYPSKSYGVSIGYSAITKGEGSIAVGALSKSDSDYAIQLGRGTNSEANSFYVATSSSNNWKMLGSDGKIPSGRLPIATSVSSSSTNDETVGAKLFYDTCGDIETLINAL